MNVSATLPGNESQPTEELAKCVRTMKGIGWTLVIM